VLAVAIATTVPPSITPPAARNAARPRADSLSSDSGSARASPANARTTTTTSAERMPHV
jgi:hypothetical protein